MSISGFEGGAGLGTSRSCFICRTWPSKCTPTRSHYTTVCTRFYNILYRGVLILYRGVLNMYWGLRERRALEQTRWRASSGGTSLDGQIVATIVNAFVCLLRSCQFPSTYCVCPRAHQPPHTLDLVGVRRAEHRDHHQNGGARRAQRRSALFVSDIFIGELSG